MKLIRTGSDNHPTGANSPLLGTCETQLELQLTDQLTLAIEITYKDIPMKSAEIRKAATHDLRQHLKSEHLEQSERNTIRCELSVRNIINTSSTDGCNAVARLESDPGFDRHDKNAILDEAERRERNGLNRLTLQGKIRATKKRIAKNSPEEEAAA